MQSPRICAVIVTYHPELDRLRRLIASIPEAEQVAIIDNGSPALESELLVAQRAGVTVKKLGANKGIATAQNEGASIARAVGAEFALFFDQDSAPRPGMIAKLHAAYLRLSAQGYRVGCVGPRYLLEGSDQPANFMRIGWLRLHREPCPDDDAAIECDFLLSSGSLVPLAVLQEVGGMDDGLFIDMVDTEWCLRARFAGYRIFGVCGALLGHRLGEGVVRIWVGRWRNLFRHKPFRYYYIFRNTLLVMRRRHVPLNCKVFFGKWLLALFIVFGVFAGRELQELKMMLRGVRDGLMGRIGRLDH